MKIWFLLNNGQVTGPMAAEELETHLVTAKEVQIWGRGQSEWMTPDKWKKMRALNGEGADRNQGLPVDNGLRAKTWRIRLEGREMPPQSFADMMFQLKALKDYSIVEVKMDGANQWREVYAVQDIVDELGISRRSHPRVPILGMIECETSRGKFSGKAISISEGGLGMTEAGDLVIGESIKVLVKSPNLFVTIACHCEVVYVGHDGYAGLKFENLPTEAKSSIIEYVNKFSVQA